MKCNNCKGEFSKVHFGDIIVMNCNGCGVFYVKEEQFKELTKEPEKYAGLLTEPEYSRYEVENKKKKKCPECQKTMEKHNFAWDSDILVDVCNTCKSVWLDQGEISKLAEYMGTHHEPVFQEIKHDMDRVLTTIKYFMYKVGRIFHT